ncbi:MAG: thioredoxin family protein [Planctomycetota bacterium]
MTDPALPVPPTLTAAAFDSAVASGPVIVMFCTADCAPCKLMKPVLADLADALGERAVVGTIDIVDEPELALRVGVMGVPMISGYANGEVRWGPFFGALPAPRLRALADELIAAASV